MDINEVCKFPVVKASEIFEGMESEAQQFAELLAKVGEGKPLYEVWNTEMEQPETVRAGIWHLTSTSAKGHFTFGRGDGQYIGGQYGDGWVLFNIGCPIDGGVDSLLVTDATGWICKGEYA